MERPERHGEHQRPGQGVQIARQNVGAGGEQQNADQRGGDELTPAQILRRLDGLGGDCLGHGFARRVLRRLCHTPS